MKVTQDFKATLEHAFVIAGQLGGNHKKPGNENLRALWEYLRTLCNLLKEQSGTVAGVLTITASARRSPDGRFVPAIELGGKHYIMAYPSPTALHAAHVAAGPLEAMRIMLAHAIRQKGYLEIDNAPASVSYYFVLKGLLNGQRGMPCIPAGGGSDAPQADGWYYLLDGMADGEGPFESREQAEVMGKAALETAQSEG